MTHGRAGLAAAALVAVCGSVAAAPSHLTAAPQLAAAYDLILDGRFDQAIRAADAACPPAPPIACDLLQTTATWWRIQLDDQSTAHDEEFSSGIESVIERALAWTADEPRRAEAWFYLGAAYGARAQWRVLRGERLAAARDGKRIKEALEQALALDAELYDARFGIGLYKYYADVAPAAAKFLRFFLLLPGGDRAEGLRDMLTARDRGALLRGEADYQLHWIYLWYEQQPQRALDLLDALHARYPANPLFARRIAEVQAEYFHDTAAAADMWLSLAAAAEAGRVSEARLALTEARLGAAEQLDALFETDRALELAAAVVADRPPAPYESLARAYLLVGRFQDRLGRPDEARQAYRAALGARTPRDVLDIEGRARVAMHQTPNARAAAAYRTSLEGWRAFEHGSLQEAERLLDRAARGTPDDPVLEYRRGRVFAAERDAPRALTAFGHVIAARPVAPPVILARAYLERARLLEARRDDAGALDAYRSATRVFGGDDATRATARRAITRLERSDASRR